MTGVRPAFQPNLKKVPNGRLQGLDPGEVDFRDFPFSARLNLVTIGMLRTSYSVAGAKQEQAADQATAILLERLSFDPEVQKAQAEFEQAQRLKRNSPMILMGSVSRIGKLVATDNEISDASSARQFVRPTGLSKHELRFPTLRPKPFGEILRSSGRSFLRRWSAGWRS
jgi:hypothetical protein